MLSEFRGETFCLQWLAIRFDRDVPSARAPSVPVANEFFRLADDFGNETNEIKKLKINRNEMDRVKIVDGGMENGNQRLANNDIVISYYRRHHP